MEGFMVRTKPATRPGQKPGETYVGGLVSDKLWREVKLISIDQKKTITAILTEALRMYVKSSVRRK
jgi:hypothetical protein